MNLDFVNQIVTIGVAVLSAWLAAKLALRKFLAEKTWVRKSEIYTNILASIHEIVYFLKYMKAVENNEKEPTEERYRLLEEKRREAQDMLLKDYFVNSFLLSEDAQQVLNQLVENIDASAEKSTTIEYADYLINELEDRAKSLRKLAIVDLRK